MHLHLSPPSGTLLFAALLALAAGAAHATLGRPLSSVQDDQIRMRAAHAVRQADAYTVHQITTPTGTVVREYASNATGQVFAVAWEGPFLPDLRQLLGDHFQPFVDSAAPQGRSRNSLLLRRPGLVVYSGGHMRAFSGRAYLPNQLPEGVYADQLR